jgi:hypothetical protein
VIPLIREEVKRREGDSSLPFSAGRRRGENKELPQTLTPSKSTHTLVSPSLDITTHTGDENRANVPNNTVFRHKMPLASWMKSKGRIIAGAAVGWKTQLVKFKYFVSTGGDE